MFSLLRVKVHKSFGNACAIVGAHSEGPDALRLGVWEFGAESGRWAGAGGDAATLPGGCVPSQRLTIRGVNSSDVISDIQSKLPLCLSMVQQILFFFSSFLYHSSLM